jgi:hypothetical protein
VAVRGALKDKGLAPETPVEIWFQDEARVGQKNGLTYQWAPTGERPRQPKDQRYDSAYIFGAICPARGTGAALVMPYANTEAMNGHLAEIALNVAPDAHAVVLIDGAGWHTSTAIVTPANITLLKLPAYCPELNAQENIWQYMRQNWLSNRIFADYAAIREACCNAWNNLIADPKRITTIGTRDWASISQNL